MPLCINEEEGRLKDERVGEGRAQMRIKVEGSGLKDKRAGEERAPMCIEERSGLS